MINLYTAPTPNGHKASVTLEELGLPYQCHAINLSANDQKTPAFLALNPNGRIPVIQDLETGEVVFESGAIMIYLADETRARDDFFIGNMIPTCISDDLEAAKAVNRRTLTSYAMLPNYRAYWKAAGYEEEMDGIEAALAAGDRDRVPHFLTDRWLADTTLFGTAEMVRDGVEAWFDAGIKTPIIVPSSASGGQMVAFQEFLSIY